MTIQQIRYILVLAETGSMNKAAEELFISQPTLTSALKELEKELHITIFNRTNKGVVLTKSGEEFLIYAKQVYSQFSQLEERYIFSGKAKRKFAVSTQHYSFAIEAFVNMLKKYDLNSYDFQIKETKTMDVILDVAQSRSEIGILGLNDINEKYISKLLDANNLEFYPIVQCNAYVYLHKDHPLAKLESISLKQLDNYPCISFDQGDNNSIYLAEEILTENEYSRTIKTNDRATNLNLMISLNGYTLCPGIVSDELNSTDFKLIRYEADAENPNRIMTIGYIQLKNNILSRIGENYIRELNKISSQSI